MADNYCESSSLINIPKDKMDEAAKIVERIENELGKNGEEWVGFAAEMVENGVWIYSDETINPERAEALVRELVEELDLPGVYVCSWSYTCSKPRIDEFGGGAFAVKKGKDTIWVDAATRARGLANLVQSGEETNHE